MTKFWGLSFLRFLFEYYSIHHSLYRIGVYYTLHVCRVDSRVLAPLTELVGLIAKSQSFCNISTQEVVLDEVRQTLGRLDTLCIPIHPVSEFLRHGAHLALEVIASTLFLAHTCPFVQFLTFGKLRDGVATAEGITPLK